VLENLDTLLDVLDDSLLSLRDVTALPATLPHTGAALLHHAHTRTALPTTLWAHTALHRSILSHRRR
jgi:hypothetical protein